MERLLFISFFVMLLPHSQTVIAQDDPLTFVLTDTSILEGQLLRVHDSCIFIDTAGIDWEDSSFDSTADHYRIGVDELLVVYVPADYRIFDGMWKGLAIGLGAGIALGALADLTTDDDAGSHGSHPPDTYIGLTTALLAPSGLLIGTIVGFATTREAKTIMMGTEGALEELSSYALFKTDEGTQQ